MLLYKTSAVRNSLFDIRYSKNDKVVCHKGKDYKRGELRNKNKLSGEQR
jgi:hypothetical protein